MDKILEDSDKLIQLSWKDQKEGLEFIENPAYLRKMEKDLSKKEQLEIEIKNLEGEIMKRNEEIEQL